MDPMTLFSIAQVAVQGVQLIQNWFAGQSAFAQAKNRQATQSDFLNQGHEMQTKNMAGGYLEAQKAVAKVSGQVETSFAERGITGPTADLAATAAANEAGNQIDAQYSQQRAAENLQFAQQKDQLAQAGEDLQAQQDQFALDTLMGGLGVGLSAFSLMVPKDVTSPGTTKLGVDQYNPPQGYGNKIQGEFDPNDVTAWKRRGRKGSLAF